MGAVTFSATPWFPPTPLAAGELGSASGVTCASRNPQQLSLVSFQVSCVTLSLPAAREQPQPWPEPVCYARYGHRECGSI